MVPARRDMTGGGGSLRVRRLQAHERDLFKRLRRAALAESPEAFGETLAAAEGQPDSYWDTLVASTTPQRAQTTFIVEDDLTPIGVCFGLLDRNDATVGHLGGMWVAPTARGQGAGRALVDALVAWARERGFARLEPWVTDGNTVATALYARAGFAVTGRRRPLPSNPSRDVAQMSLVL